MKGGATLKNWPRIRLIVFGTPWLIKPAKGFSSYGDNRKVAMFRNLASSPHFAAFYYVLERVSCLLIK